MMRARRRVALLNTGNHAPFDVLQQAHTAVGRTDLTLWPLQRGHHSGPFGGLMSTAPEALRHQCADDTRGKGAAWAGACVMW